MSSPSRIASAICAAPGRPGGPGAAMLIRDPGLPVLSARPAPIPRCRNGRYRSGVRHRHGRHRSNVRDLRRAFGPVAETTVYLRGPGTVVRCPDCSATLMALSPILA